MPQRPNFFVAGAAKSGTSSLFHYLGAHPDVYKSPSKEPHFFCSQHFPERFTGPGDEGFSRDTVRDEAAYRRLFSGADAFTAAGEASVYYLLYPDVAECIQAWNPQAKIILLLRNPVDRAFSAYMHLIRDGRETLSFERALVEEPARKAAGYQPLWWYREVGMYMHKCVATWTCSDATRSRSFSTRTLLRQMTSCGTACLSRSRYDVDIDTGVRHNVSGVPRSRKMYEFWAKPNPVKQLLKPFLPAGLRTRMAERAKEMTMRRDRPRLLLCAVCRLIFTTILSPCRICLAGTCLDGWIPSASSHRMRVTRRRSAGCSGIRGEKPT